MDEQPIFERIMNRRNADRHEEDITLLEAFLKPEVDEESHQEETETVKTHNRLLLMSSAGVIMLGVLATVVLAQQNVISLPAIASVTDSLTAGKTDSPIEMAQNNKQKRDTASEAAAPAAQTATGQQKTVFNEHVDKAGVTACKDVFPALGYAAAAGATFNASTTWSEKNPANHSISSVVGMSFDTGQMKGSGVSFVFSAPTPEKGGCEGNFVRVVPIAQDCNSFASTLPNGSKAGQPLQGIPVIILPSGLQTLLISTAGNGCVVMTTSRAVAPAG